MSDLHHCRSDSSSWSVLALSGQDIATEAIGPTVARSETANRYAGCETPPLGNHNEVSFTKGGMVTGPHEEAIATSCLEKDYDDEHLLQSSAESWVELNPAELGASPETQHPLTDMSASTRMVVVAQPCALLSSALEDAEENRSLEELETQDEVAPCLPAPQEPSYTLPSVNEEVGVSALTRLLIGETKASTEVTEQKPRSSFSSRAADMSDDLASVDDDGTQVRQTVCVDPDSETSISELKVSANSSPMVGITEVLHRRVIQEDLLRTERGPSELPLEERMAVIHALFGDFGDAPISAEKFREVMVPYQRHCECLGASYGFHHQSCRFFAEFPVSL
ncbi:hypothetical protein, unknown function [Leishmania braziliensis MHOM/BR/75/M2904]|uniref:Uncharacterized protein n=2 Tax=Leishmania braziliensis TaxID=5660 RepID=A4HG64_LEIBR|nr:hypothetical protein, unknown function [Leishmania braziliensis MHOM/BR/75/M2904]KAI5685669.1 hypothetical protein MNV84_05154 [Leishmania braziliensis]CAJ2475601.1 unnamed protein product [Leishmania braziliensis]CAM39554.1 hypothetical protein, unknown function [Leishmania braziliensis MHOM/BR/75/M2904]SYZ67214.1 hypothetical_protein [Leishmania braziliensis MHOM/BR/75/M2904]